MGQNFPLFPERASSVAGGVDALFLLLVAVAVFFSVLIGVAIFYLSFRYRRRPDNQVGQLVPGSEALEIAWTVIPFVIAMVLFGWGAKLYVTIRQSPSDAPAPAATSRPRAERRESAMTGRARDRRR